MTPILDLDRCVLLHGDASEIGGSLPPESIDALVTDPPAGIGFMGEEWDHGVEFVARMRAIFAGALRVLKPGSHGLVWALPRTAHWTTRALEEAGFEIRDVIVHLFGSGFPKSLNVSSAIDGVVARRSGTADGKGLNVGFKDRTLTAAVTPDAARWDGWGTGLKPAAEHWILCRKPLIGTVAANVLTHGTGAINVDACRIGLAPSEDPEKLAAQSRGLSPGFRNGFVNGTPRGWWPAPPTWDCSKGRWPANVILDPEAGALLDAQSGLCGQTGPGGDEPSAAVAPVARRSRFFYCAKPCRKERDAGCEHLPSKTGGEATDRADGSAGTNPRAGAGRMGGARNFHPTVKSIALMHYLCRLITPPGGIVLDLFAGSGSTGVAALAEGFSFIGVEKSDEYLPIIKARLLNALEGEVA